MCHIFNLSPLCVYLINKKIVVTFACTPHLVWCKICWKWTNLKEKARDPTVLNPIQVFSPWVHNYTTTQLYISGFMRWNNHVTRLSAAIQWARLVCPLPSSLWYWWSFWVVQVLRSVSLCVSGHPFPSPIFTLTLCLLLDIPDIHYLDIMICISHHFMKHTKHKFIR